MVNSIACHRWVDGNFVGCVSVLQVWAPSAARQVDVLPCARRVWIFVRDVDVSRLQRLRQDITQPFWAECCERYLRYGVPSDRCGNNPSILVEGSYFAAVIRSRAQRNLELGRILLETTETHVSPRGLRVISLVLCCPARRPISRSGIYRECWCHSLAMSHSCPAEHPPYDRRSTDRRRASGVADCGAGVHCRTESVS